MRVFDAICCEHRLGEEEGAQLLEGLSVGWNEGTTLMVGDDVTAAAITVSVRINEVDTPTAIDAATTTKQMTANSILVRRCFQNGRSGSA